MVGYWIVQSSGHPDTKACPSTASRHFPAPPTGGEVGMDVRMCKLNEELNANNGK